MERLLILFLEGVVTVREPSCSHYEAVQGPEEELARSGALGDMDAILRIARKPKLIVVEDCAHALEAEYHGQKAGTFGTAGCLSFYVTNNIVTGEGGRRLE